MTEAPKTLDDEDYEATMRRNRVMRRAYVIDPECWISYSGKDRRFKQRTDSRRTAAIRQAEREEKL